MTPESLITWRARSNTDCRPHPPQVLISRFWGGPNDVLVKHVPRHCCCSEDHTLKTTAFFITTRSTGVNSAPPTDIWQHLETFLVFTAGLGGGAAGLDGERPETLLSILQRRAQPPQQRTTWSETSLVSRLRSPALPPHPRKYSE